MNSKTALYTDLTVVAISFIAGVVRLKRLDKAGKLVLVLLAAILVVESIAHVYARKYKNNMPVYNIYSMLEFAIMAFYFNYSIDIFRQKKIGWMIFGLGIVIAALNYTLVQPLTAFNSYYLFFEGFTIIVLALIAFYRLLLHNEDLRLYRYCHFWFTAVFLFFWSATYLTWGLYPAIKDKENQERMYFLIWIANIITYGSIGVIFQLYPRKIPNHE